jgi:hypothetical protein
MQLIQLQIRLEAGPASYHILSWSICRSLLIQCSEIIRNSKFGKETEETGTRRNRGFLVEDSETSTTTNNKNIKNTTARGWHKQRTSGNSGYSRLRVGLAKTAERDLLQYVTSLEFYVKGLKEKKIRRANFVVSNSIPPLHDPLLKWSKNLFYAQWRHLNANFVLGSSTFFTPFPLLEFH